MLSLMRRKLDSGDLANLLILLHYHRYLVARFIIYETSHDLPVVCWNVCVGMVQYETSK